MKSNKKSRIIKISILFIILILAITIISTITVNKIIAATEGEGGSIDKSSYTESEEMGEHRKEGYGNPNEVQDPTATGETEGSNGERTVKVGTSEVKEETYVDENGNTKHYLTSDTLTYIDEDGKRKPAAPKIGDDSLFCIEPGGHVSTVNIRDGYMYEQWAADAEKWKNDVISNCRTVSDICDEASPKGKDNEHPYGLSADKHTITTPVYYIRGETIDLPPAMAYMVSAGEGWNINTQRGIWNLLGKDIGGGIVHGSGEHSAGGASSFDASAGDYAAYHEAISASGGINPGGDSGGVAFVQADVAGGTYKAGPFSVTYNNAGTKFNGGTSYAGISNMTVVGHTLNGGTVDLGGNITYSGGTVGHFFTPGEGLEDKAAQQYPDSGEAFYVEFGNPNGNVSDPGDYVAYVSVKVEFEWMLAFGKATLYEGKQYRTIFNIDHDYNTHKDSKTESYEDIATLEEWKRSGQKEEDFVEGESKVIKYRTDTHESAGCKITTESKAVEEQDIMIAEAHRYLYSDSIELQAEIPQPPDDDEPPPEDQAVSLFINLGGVVWEDSQSGKETEYNGIMNINEAGSTDRPLENVKVTLYNEDGSLATVYAGPLYSQRYSHMNPTYTNANGEYLFMYLDPMKRYYVTFEYDGQIYTPTDYMKTGQNGENYYQINSKATEENGERNSYNNMFGEIRTYPENYVTSNSLGYSLMYDKSTRKYYNSTFTRLDLMGYKLNTNGRYEQNASKLPLMDGYAYDENGVETTQRITRSAITLAREALITNGYSPTNKQIADKVVEMYGNTGLFGTVEELKMKLQFIEDCKMTAYTKSQNSAVKDLYPTVVTYSINDRIVEDGEGGATFTDEDGNQYNLKLSEENTWYYQTREEFVSNGEKYWKEFNVPVVEKTYEVIYPQGYYINLGLCRRQSTNIQLRKDLYKIGVTVNGQSQSYKAETQRRSEGDNTEQYWEITVRVSDYNNYYGQLHYRPLYKADANANANSGIDENKLSEANQTEIYVTYKISLKNIAGTAVRIDEIVDYYDQEYEFIPEMSWLMHGNDIGIKDNEYVAIIDGRNIGVTGNSKFIPIKPGRESSNEPYEHTQYVPGTEYKNLQRDGQKYNTAYIKLDGYILNTTNQKSEYIYLTFKVNRDQNGKLKLDTKDNIGSAKYNLAEINGYTNYYELNTNLPNGIKKSQNGTYEYAGIIDVNSTPGNFHDFTRENGIYEHRFEDDTDEAIGLILYEEDYERKISGTVWEDKRTYSPEGTNALIGNGRREDGEEATLSGIDVSLWEVAYDENGKKQIDANGNPILKPALIYEGSGTNGYWDGTQATTKTNSDGTYSFEGFIPGDYIVRFTYNGETYNGQDYKSTSYQRYLSNSGVIAISQDGQTDVSTNEINAPHYYGYIDPENEAQNESTGYGYNIGKADEFEYNVSDAKDIGSIRDLLNSKYISEVKNNLAETQKIGSQNSMVAETGVIRAEVEYNRESSNGNIENEEYHIADVDFGLEERPKAGLELNKRVSNVKITLADKTVLFDATQTVDDLIWQGKEEYEINVMKGMSDYDKGPSASNPGRVYSDYTENYNGDNNHSLFRIAVANRVITRAKGLIQATMDEEIMHGATIEITYDLKVTNIGEEDYNNRTFYYTGNIDSSAKNTIVKTKADVVLDYVANNLQFKAENNDASWGWSQITENTAINYLANALDGENASDVISKYNTIITTTALNAPLVPIGSENNTGGARGNSITETVHLLLKQTISPQNTADEFLYGNIAEIVSISNDVGRRMAFSIQGNQNPASQITEPDTSRAEDVSILPPFGENKLYIGLAIFIITLIVVSIVVIKRVVLE